MQRKWVKASLIYFFSLFNEIHSHATNSGLYYQSVIDTIADVGPCIKGPTRYQISITYLEEEVQELEVYKHIEGQMAYIWVHNHV